MEAKWRHAVSFLKLNYSLMLPKCRYEVIQFFPKPKVSSWTIQEAVRRQLKLYFMLICFPESKEKRQKVG
jgi:hypothetical protein